MTHGTSRRTRRLRRCPRSEILEGRTLLNAGALDTTFGGTGMVTTAIGYLAVSEAVAVQSDSKVVVAGYDYQQNKSSVPAHFTIARYNSNGSLDSTFGSRGVAVIPLSTFTNGVVSGDGAYAVAIQPDGKIVAAGYDLVANKKPQGTYYSDFAVVRLNTNGTLDTTFGGGAGYVTTRLTPALQFGSNWAASIALQTDGRIVVGGDLGGVSLSGTIDGTAVVRYNANGSLDTTFGTGGIVVNTGIYDFFDVDFVRQIVAIDGSGRIDLGGESTVTSTMAVARYLANGTLDSTFGTGGVVDLPLPAGASQATAASLALQSTGKIVAYGPVKYSGAQDVPTLVRLNSDGSLDTSFGASGIYTESRMAGGTSMVIQPADDKIVAVGQGWVNGKSDGQFWVTRVLADGSAYDSTFGINGLTEANFNMATGGPTSVALDPGGKIVVTGGGLYSGNKNFTTSRFLGDSSSPSIALPASAVPSGATISAPNAILGALVLNDPTFLDSLPSGKHRRLN